MANSLFRDDMSTGEHNKHTNQNHCHKCHAKLPQNDLISHASMQVNRNVAFLETEEGTICPNCVSTFLQLHRKLRSENKLFSLYTRTMKMYQYNWSDIGCVPNVTKYVDKCMELGEYKLDEEYSLLKRDILLTTINVKEIFRQYDNTALSIMGVSLPNDTHVPLLNANLIKCPKEGFGLVRLPRKNDFIVLVKSGFDDICILEQSLNEMSLIGEGKINSRAGAAGGIMLPFNNCQSLSKVTRQERLLVARPKSVGMSLSYRNYKGEVKGRSSVYNDLYMTRYNSQSKYRLVIKSVALQRLLITEMISRLRCFMILDHVGLIPIKEGLQTFFKYDKQRKQMEQGFISIGKTKLQSRLLSWACSTGEMRNHQAVSTHYDGNKSHPVETMSLFGRIPLNINQLKVDYVNTMKAGYLILPMEGVTVEINCGRELIHCSLKSTIHLADNTRNTCNWLKVHGP